MRSVERCKRADNVVVVDLESRVRGVDRVHAADASIMSGIVGGNTNAPTNMIEEEASDLIRASHH